MQAPQSIRISQFPTYVRRTVHHLGQQQRGDAAVLIGLPLLTAVGVVVGVINLLAVIHLVAVLING